MIGPPLRKFSTKKFLSNSLCGVPLGLGEAVAAGEAAVVVVVVAGDIAAVEGVVPGSGEIPGAVAAGLVPVTAGAAGVVTGAVAGAVAGLVAVVGGAPGGLLAGEVAGGGWPNEVSARVTVQRLAISSVFIGLISVLSRPRIPMSWVSS
jgi:hypothetical protein